MKILLSGAHGLIGSALRTRLLGEGHDVVVLKRLGNTKSRADDGAASISWDPANARIDGVALASSGPFHGVVHLGGAGIGDKRWTQARRREIRSSRLDSTELLAREIAQLEPRPDVFIVASAIGYYGDRGSETLTEDSARGDGFLAQLCQEWESATNPASEAGVRVVNLRSGIVLSVRGGALARQLPLFRLGLGGRLGNGRQFVSWISLNDEVGVIRHAIENPALVGPLNATAPDPVTNAAFTKALGRALHRPALFVVPRPALALALGAELVDEMLLASQRVMPAKLISSEFQFVHPQLESALMTLTDVH
jgi:uncharacterized protein (TIGR01777 family)